MIGKPNTVGSGLADIRELKTKELDDVSGGATGLGAVAAETALKVTSLGAVAAETALNPGLGAVAAANALK
jgi:hypothetical protein